VVTALVMAVVATYLASLGNICSARNQSQNLPVLQTNAIGMAYGTLLMLGIALASGRSFSFEWTVPYVGSLLFLAVFGSIFAFGCYLTLVGRLGADKAAYAGLLFPVVALQLSVWFEGYQWTSQSLLGMGLILLGNFIALAPDKYVKRRRRVAAHDARRVAPCAANPADS
jgi:drug/metabolite transporter (DMT)-like permease